MSNLIVWYVSGDSDSMLWKTKEDAEKWAREIFPHDEEHRRYQRIFYKKVYSYEQP